MALCGWAAPAMQRTIGQYRTTDVTENLGMFLFGTQRTDQWKDLILTVKIETRYLVENNLVMIFRHL